MLTNEQFERTRGLALGLAGIELASRHRELLDRRSRRLGADGVGDFDALLTSAEGGDAAARRRLIGLLTTNFTGFFRHARHFDLAAEQALWAAHRRGSARLWSAGAATGEEPYSLAIALIEVFRRDDPPVTIVASDVDAGALEVARRGEYGEGALSALGPERRTRFFDRPALEGRWRVAASVRDLVEFHEASLVEPGSEIEGPFDVVFCRNVLMYLGQSRREAALGRIASMLSAGGLLLLDPAEYLGACAPLFGPGEDGVFRLAGRRP